MTETNTAITEAIVKCDEIKARLETLQDMLKPKPVLCLESITRPGTYRELQSADELHDCPEGTVIAASDGHRYMRIDHWEYQWATSYGTRRENDDLWSSLVCRAGCGITFKYLAVN